MSTVRELMLALSLLPQDARVMMSYAGGSRHSPDCTWVSRNGYVVIANSSDTIDFNEDRPAGAPACEEQKELWPDDIQAVLMLGK